MATTNSQVWIVIPAYNESSVIADVLCKLKENFKAEQIVVVDDCSVDLTASVVRENSCTLLSHPINLGQGAALQTGITFALENGAEFIVTFDSDGQHRVEDALNMLTQVQSGECKIVCGSRFLGLEAKNLSFSKLITLKLAVIFTKLTTGVSVTDAHNGLRVMTRSAARLINLKQNRMAHASELIGIIKKNNIEYMEYPVKIIYSDYSMNKGQKISNSFNIILDLLIGRILK